MSAGDRVQSSGVSVFQVEGSDKPTDNSQQFQYSSISKLINTLFKYETTKAKYKTPNS
jgi:hypothetical protein